MKKVKIMLLLLISIAICTSISVKAEENEVYFVSSNGVELTKKEYDFFVEIYTEETVNNLTQEKYDLVNNHLDINNNEIETVVKEDIFYDIAPPGISLYGTFVETNYKKIAMSKSCLSDGSCKMTVTLNWKAQPATHSYDVFGARYSGYTTLDTGNVFTVIGYDTKTMYCGNYKFRDDGHACHFKLDDSAKIQELTQIFSVKNGGTVYASYQHAQSNISLTNSQKYYFGIAGLGNVFCFYDEAFNVYDGMNGVWLDI